MNNMPLLREYTQNLRKHEDIVLLHINHDVDNSYRFNEFLETVFDRVFFIPVSYDEDSEHKTCGSFQKHIEEQIERVLSEAVIPTVGNGKKLIVIEDGGYFLPVYVRTVRKYPSLEGNILGVVEQTTSGTRRTLSHSIKNVLGFPCASVARSKVKMNLESIFIGQRVVEELSLFLYSANTFLNFGNVLIIGYGIVGRSVFKSLGSYSCDISVYDSDETIRKTAETDMCKVYSEVSAEMFKRDTILIGCVGSSVFSEKMLRAFMDGEAQNLYLASASSKNYEFILLIEMARREKSVGGITLTVKEKREYYTLCELEGNGRKKRIFLFAEGMPINFYRKNVISLTDRMIDLVFLEMLMLAEIMCTHFLADGMYLLGESGEFKTLINEDELLKRWFSINGFSFGNSLEETLGSHPDTDYLRNPIPCEQ